VRAINDAGLVVCTGRGPDGEDRVFVWEDGVMARLPALGGGDVKFTDMNEAGQIVGESPMPNGQAHATIWQKVSR